MINERKSFAKVKIYTNASGNPAMRFAGKPAEITASMDRLARIYGDDATVSDVRQSLIDSGTPVE